MVDKLKQYWWAVALGILAIYFLFFNKKGKNVRRRTSRRVRRGYRRARSRYVSYRGRRRSRRMSRRR